MQIHLMLSSELDVLLKIFWGQWLYSLRAQLYVLVGIHKRHSLNEEATIDDL